jgi:ATP-dependent RNA helicase DHX57
MPQFPTALSSLPTEFDDLSLAPAPPTPEERATADELLSMGFRKGHVAAAMSYVSLARSSSSSTSDPLLRSLATLPLRTAMLSHLHLHVPEEDLPVSLRSSRPADATARIATSKDSEALGRLWKAEKMAREVGMPVGVVEKVLEECDGREGRGIELLVRRLVGWTGDDEEGGEEEEKLSDARLLERWAGEVELSDEERKALEERREDELVGLEGMFGERFRRTEAGLEILASSTKPRRRQDSSSPPDQVILRVLFHPSSLYPSPSEDPTTSTPHLPTFYVYSSTLPPYIRLHLTSLLATQFISLTHGDDWRDLAHAGYGGVVGEMATFLTDVWQEAVENPPDSRQVLSKLLGSRIVQPTSVSTASTGRKAPMRARGGPVRGVATPAQHAALLRQFEANALRPGYEAMLAVRSRLPAWSMKEQIVDLIRSNRVVIVSGETGSGKTTQGE